MYSHRLNTRVCHRAVFKSLFRLPGIALAFIAAGGMVSTATAAPKPSAVPAAFQQPRPAPASLIDIDFRRDGLNYFAGLEAWAVSGSTATLDRFQVEASGGDLTQNRDCTDPLSFSPDGFGVGNIVVGKDCDDDLGSKESLTLSVTQLQAGGAVRAFDTRGLWLAGVTDDKGGEGGQVVFTGVDPADVKIFSFSWKDITSDPASPNDNNEFYVGFGETVRFTKAVVTSTSGAFSVIGFYSEPIVLFGNTQCINDPDPDGVQDPEGNSSGCKAEEAKNLYLNLEPSTGGPGDKGVTGTEYKRGTYEGVDPRPQCQPEYATDPTMQLPFEQWQPLPINLAGDGEPEVILKPWQCGYPKVPGGLPYYTVVEIDGSELQIQEDTIEAVFKDDENLLPESEWQYWCRSLDPYRRPRLGSVPIDGDFMAPYDEIPVLAGDGSFIREMQDTTSGPCNGGRFSSGGRSYLLIVVNPAGTDYVTVLQERIDRLDEFVQQLFPCLQEGVNASLVDNARGIGNTFAQGKYDQTVDGLKQMKATALSNPLLDSIGAGACYFDMDEGQYLAQGEYPPPNTDGIEVPGSDPARFKDANAVGYLLSQIEHLAWTIITVLDPYGDGTIPADCDGAEDSFCGY